MEASGEFHGPVALIQGKTPDFQPHKKLGKTHREKFMQMQSDKNRFSGFQSVAHLVYAHIYGGSTYS